MAALPSTAHPLHKVGMSQPPSVPPPRAASVPVPGNAPPPLPAPLQALCGDTERARLSHFSTLEHVLFGESIIDAPRLWASEPAAIDHFLRLNGFDLDNSLDKGRLDDLLHEATEYLVETHHYRLPLPVEQPTGGVQELMMWAASPSLSREQRFSCMTLKAMCILHHISGRELLFNTAISEAELFESLSARVFSCIDHMRSIGIGVSEFAAGKKSRTSLTTKLLAKRTNLATHIFDKLRFRVVVETSDDVVFAMLYLLEHLIPFNYVLPEQSENTILRAPDVARIMQLDEQVVSRAWQRPRQGVRRRAVANEFSSKTYRTINFVADIPLRIDHVAPYAVPAIAFVQTEIQLVDKKTAAQNELGESAHPLYKKRQRARVRARLENQRYDPDPALEAIRD